MSSRSSLRLAAVLPLALVVLLPSCSHDDPDPPSAAPTTTAPATTQSQAEADEAALRQLAEDWYSRAEAMYRNQDPAGSAAAYLTGEYLDVFVERLTDFMGGGYRSVASAESAHTVLAVRVDGNTAVVEECIVDADTVISADGATLDDSVKTTTYETTAERTTDGWRFAARVAQVQREGAQPCDAP